MFNNLEGKIVDKYGVAGGFILIVAFFVIVGGWLYFSKYFIWPFGIPVVIAAWMIWQISREEA